MMITSMKTKMTVQSTVMTERILIYDGYLETSRTFKIKCQCNREAISGKWCILAVTFV